MNIEISVQDYFTTVTLWGTCGRYSGRSYHEWDGVVCLGDDKSTNKEGKVRLQNYYESFRIIHTS